MYNLKLLIFPLILVAVSGYMFGHYHLSLWQLVFFIPSVAGVAVVSANKENPAEAGRVAIGVVLCVLSLLIIGVVGATKIFG